MRTTSLHILPNRGICEITVRIYVLGAILKNENMSSTEEENYTEYDYFKKRKTDKIYVSKVFPYKSFSGSKFKEQRFIKKVFDKSEDNEFVKVKGEIVLRSSSSGRDQVSAIIVSDGNDKFMSFTLQKFRENPKSGLNPILESSFSFRQGEFVALLKFLSDLKFIDFEDKSRFTISDSENINNKISLLFRTPEDADNLINQNDVQLISSFLSIKGSERVDLLKSLRNMVLSKEDLDILSGRKEGLELFKKELYRDEQEWNEKQWQNFFKDNPWIFGYGLDYRFLNIIQKEASVSNVDLDGKQTVISDFLLSDTRFTVLVELKRPDTPLFESDANRSKSWRLSKDITNSVSQILTQKAEWEYKSQTEQFDSEDKRIEEKTVNPKTILIIGNTSQFSGNDRESIIKAKTFELYRRNSRNIEIITFDELYERASFIVNNKTAASEETNLKTDDLPF